MKLTLDRMCIQAGKLCASCEELYQQELISDIDIDVGKVLMKVAKSQKFLSNISIYNIIETESTIIIITAPGDKEKLDRAGSFLLNNLAEIDKRDFIFLVKTKNPNKFIEGLIGSELLVGTSTVFLPPFSDKELKVQVKKDNKNKLKIVGKDLSKVTKALLGINAHYAFV
ncbi:MAG: hypothetical protein HeimC2_27860 [Candidatus Heimdallarchaeota archaeon LC_2]|nr:MAG: hypothetical protein HeimC2_27860 [Candidatus Heimdallarchaeota archaeon LC_2]